MRMPPEVAWALRIKPVFGSDEARTAMKILARHKEGACAQCHGTGAMLYPNDGGGGMSTLRCPPCEGTGRVWVTR